MKKLLFMTAVLFLTFGAPLWAAEEGAHGEGEHEQTIWQTIGQWTNFLVLVGLVVLFLRKVVRVQDKFKTQSEEIRRSIESAREAKEEAERQMAAMNARMQQMNDEVAGIKERALQDAEEEKNRILDSAQKEAQRIVEMAHREIDNEVRYAQMQLRKQAGDLAVKQGKQIIEQEINDEDQRRLIRSYIDEFGK